jgi:heme/copper-type cytochrome/quinol oxidase subunit 2
MNNVIALGGVITFVMTVCTIWFTSLYFIHKDDHYADNNYGTKTIVSLIVWFIGILLIIYGNKMNIAGIN